MKKFSYHLYNWLLISTIYSFISFSICLIWFDVIKEQVLSDSSINAFLLWWFITSKVARALCIVSIFAFIAGNLINIIKYIFITKQEIKEKKEAQRIMEEAKDKIISEIQERERERHEQNPRTFSIHN